LLATGYWLLAASAASASPTQDDVFKSIQNNVDERTDLSRVWPFIVGGAGLLIVMAVVSNRRNRVARPKGLNHPGKLVKEVMRTLPLRPAELRQLRLLADDTATGPTPVSNPLTMLLCPSLLAK